jgi:hypothetical protein
LAEEEVFLAETESDPIEEHREPGAVGEADSESGERVAMVGVTGV